MAGNVRQVDISLFIMIIGILLVGCAIGFFSTQVAPLIVFGATMGIVMFLASFVWPPIALYFLVFFMLLSPEFGSRETQGGGFTIRLEDIILVVLAFSWFVRSAIKKELGIFPTTPLNRGIAAYILLCFFSTVVGGLFGKINIIGLLFVLKYFEYFIVFYMVVNFVKTRKDVIVFVTLLLTICAIVCFFGIAQMPLGERVTAPFEGKEGEPGTLGGYLVLMLSVSIGLFLTNKSVRTKALLLFLIAINIVVIMATESRASWLGLPFMYFTFIILHKRRLIMIMAVAVLIALSPLFIPQNVKERYTGTFKREEGYKAEVGGVALPLDSSATLRVQSWQGILYDLRFHPILGYGITGYWFIDAQYFRTLIELGIVGFIIFMYLMYQIYRFLLRTYHLSDDELVKGLSMGVFAGFISLLIHAIGSNTFIIVRIMEPFWFLMGLVVVLYNLEMKQQQLQGESLFADRQEIKSPPDSDSL